MIRAIIIDDEELALNVLEILLMEIGGISVTAKFQSVLEAIEQAPTLQPELIFLDIEMPGMNGLAAGELLNQRCPNAEIIYVTAYHHYAIEAFETNAIGYLLKPVSKDRLHRTIDRFRTRRNRLSNGAAQEEVSASSVNPPPLEQTLRLKVLGSMELYGIDGSLVKWRTRKTKELFAYLWSHSGTPVYRYRILDDLWPDTEANRAQTLFHTTLYNLRHMLRNAGFPDMAAYGDERYWMDTRYIISDVGRLEALMQSDEDGEALEELLALYKGDYLETEHYPWTNSKRNELRRALIRHLDLLSHKAAGVSRERLLTKLIELDPYQKHYYERLQQYLLETGDTIALDQLSRQMKELEFEQD
jgi:two-component system, LytTR family, response regulator